MTTPDQKMLREYVRKVAAKALKEFGYDDPAANDPENSPQKPVYGHHTDEHGGIEISARQAQGLASVLGSLGVDPQTVIKPETEVTEAAAAKKLPAPAATPEVKPEKEKFKVDIDQHTIEVAQKFYEAGKMGSNWYYDANKVIQEGFSNEMDKVLFAVLLASTSVQNEIYINFIEAGALFNAIKADERDNRELLEKFANDPELNLNANGMLEHPEYGQLHLFKDTRQIKITNVGAKFGNIKRALQLYLKGQLTTEVVRSAIANSAKPGKLKFERRSPLIQRLKIANYALTLIDPSFASSKENWFNVVVDTWMFRIFYPEHAKNKDMIAKLFGNENAYMNVAKVVSDMAAQAGVSPHVMQAALWTGIKKTWEGDSAEVANYVAAIDKMTTDYAEFWKDMEKETRSLAQVISRLDATVAGQILAQKRKEVGIALGKRVQADRLAKKTAAAQQPPVAAPPPPAPVMARPRSVRPAKPTNVRRKAG